MSRLLPYETIVKAHEGDPEAVDAVLSHYAGYIRYFSKMNGQVNAEVEDYVKERLIACLLKFQFVEVRMIVPVDETNLLQAATIHSISWKESHRAFCTPDFIETHTPDRQREYLRNKMNNGTKLYMLVEEKPIGVVSVTKGLIEDLYILPDMQNMGYGTKLLLYAVGQCTDTPTLWILENNINAERLYRRIGFKETGRKNAITNKLDEIEFALT